MRACDWCNPDEHPPFSGPCYREDVHGLPRDTVLLFKHRMSHNTFDDLPPAQRKMLADGVRLFIVAVGYIGSLIASGERLDAAGAKWLSDIRREMRQLTRPYKERRAEPEPKNKQLRATELCVERMQADIKRVVDLMLDPDLDVSATGRMYIGEAFGRSIPDLQAVLRILVGTDDETFDAELSLLFTDQEEEDS
jgi:hypothetical protein